MKKKTNPGEESAYEAECQLCGRKTSKLHELGPSKDGPGPLVCGKCLRLIRLVSVAFAIAAAASLGAALFFILNKLS